MTSILAQIIVTLVVILTLLLLLLMGYLLWVQHQAGAESERRREVQRKLKTRPPGPRSCAENRASGDPHDGPKPDLRGWRRR